MNSEGVLSHLFSFVGKGHFLYVAGVSRSWRAYYPPKAADEDEEDDDEDEEDDDEDVVTTFHDAVATIPCLEYAFANDLEFTDYFRPEKDDFGPGVYEWSRHHGFPLYVWVAKRESATEALPTATVGVFSDLGKAKEAAVAAWKDSLDGAEDSVEEEEILEEEDEWEGSTGEFSLNRAPGVSVKAFPLREVAYGDEIRPLPLYVTCVCNLTTHLAAQAVVIRGVFTSKVQANQSVESMRLDYDNSLRPKKVNPRWKSSGMKLPTRPRLTHAIDWEGYLDGEGGKPGEFFKESKRKRGDGDTQDSE